MTSVRQLRCGVRSKRPRTRVGWLRIAHLAVAAAAVTAGVPAPAQTSAATLHGVQCATVVPTRVQHVTAIPPHAAWPRPLPNDRRAQWFPLAADPEHVLVEWNPFPPPTGLSRLSLGIVTRDGKRHAVAAAAYPHYGETARFHLEYPWIVGIAHVHVPPDDWVLWVGNVVTGRHLILDHYNASSGIGKEYTDVALDAHRVLWVDNAYRNVGQRTVTLWNRLDLYDLATGRQTYIASDPFGKYVYSQPTLYGNTAVWVRNTIIPGKGLHPVTDLVRYQLGSRQVTNLTHNTQLSGQSLEPSLWRHYLLFKQSPSPYSTGDIVLWDLNQRHFPLWRKPGAALLDRWGEMPLWGDGLAYWQAEYQATAAIYVAGSPTVWTLQYGPHMGEPKYQKYDWTIHFVAGRNVVLERRNAGWGGLKAHTTYLVWGFPRARSCTR